MGKRILVLGRNGELIRRIARSIGAVPDADCVVGLTPSRKDTPRFGDSVSMLSVNVHDPASLRLALEGSFAVVNAVTPSHLHEYTVAEACAGLGIHYVDLSDAHAQVDGITRLNRRALQRNCLLVSGAGTLPAVSTALVDMLAPEFDRITDIHLSFSPGNRSSWVETYLHTPLGNAGSSFRVKENGRWRYAYGWSESVKVAFPRPVGKRRVYLCDAPELDLFPTRYGAATVCFRAGLGLKFYNRGLFMLARMHRLGWIKNLPALMPTLSGASRLLRRFGSSASGLGVRVCGRTNKDDVIEHSAYLIARQGTGLAIACSPAVAVIRRWIERGVPEFGAVPCAGLLSWDEIKAEMIRDDIVLVRV